MVLIREPSLSWREKGPPRLQGALDQGALGELLPPRAARVLVRPGGGLDHGAAQQDAEEQRELP